MESSDIHKCSTCGYLKYLGPKDPNLHILRCSHKHWNIYLCNLAFNFWKLPLSWSHFNWYWNLIGFKTKVLTWEKKMNSGCPLAEVADSQEINCSWWVGKPFPSPCSGCGHWRGWKEKMSLVGRSSESTSIEQSRDWPLVKCRNIHYWKDFGLTYKEFPSSQ